MLKKGDIVRVRMAGTTDEWTNAVVNLSSHNGKSVMLELVDGGFVRARGGYVGNYLALSIDYNALSITGLEGTEYDIEVTPTDT